MAKKQERQETLHTNTPPSPPPPPHTHTHTHCTTRQKNCIINCIQTSSPLSLRQKKNVYGEEREGEKEREREDNERRKNQSQSLKFCPFSILFLSVEKKKTSSTAPTTTKIKLPVCKQFLSFQNFFVIPSTFQHGLPMSSSGNVGRKGI